MDLSVVVPSYETRDLVLSCLRSLSDELERCRVEADLVSEVIVVDNGSRDGSADAIRSAFPALELIALKHNRGFAAAVNRGIERARGRVLLLLNSDAHPQPGAIAVCLAALAAGPELAIAGPRLEFPDGRPQNSTHALPTLTTELAPKWLLEGLMPRRFPSKRQHSREPLQVEAVRGAAMFVRREVTEKLGGLNEDFFFFLEETDLCRRVGEAGGCVLLVPSSHFVHVSGASSKRVAAAATRIEFHRSLYLYMALHHGRGVMRTVVAIRFARGLGTALLLGLASPFSSHSRARFGERVALLRWHLLGCPEDGGLASQSGAREAVGESGRSS